MFSKPADMFDRDEEWAALSRFAADNRPRATLGVVSGRRRQGKTFLLGDWSGPGNVVTFRGRAETLMVLGAALLE
jgi:hypothetical protein